MSPHPLPDIRRDTQTPAEISRGKDEAVIANGVTRFMVESRQDLAASTRAGRWLLFCRISASL